MDGWMDGWMGRSVGQSVSRSVDLKKSMWLVIIEKNIKLFLTVLVKQKTKAAIIDCLKEYSLLVLHVCIFFLS